MARIVAGRFDRSVDADAALEQLKRDGFARSEVDAFYVGPPGQHARTARRRLAGFDPRTPLATVV